MQDKVIHELLRDLVGTAKANGNTDEIVAEIEKRVAEKEERNYIGTMPVNTAMEIMKAFPDIMVNGITDDNELELVVPATIDPEKGARLQRIVAVWERPDEKVLDALFG